MNAARTAAWVLASAMVVACGDDSTSADGTTGSESGAASSSGSGSSTGVAATSSGSSSTGVVDDSGTTGPDMAALEYAAGIRLTRLVVNQAVQLTLVEDGVDVAPSDYPARMIGSRRTLVRAFWNLHAGFTPHELVGRLKVDYPDGHQEIHDRTVMVAGESTDDTFAFDWLLEPEQVVPGMAIRVQALEPDPTLASGTISEPPPILPYGGSVALEMVDSPMEIQVVLIPVQHMLDGCEMTPSPTEDDVTAMVELMEENNALHRAIITVGEPMPYTQPIGNQDMGFVPILAELALRRDADAPADNVYYYALLDSCDGFPGGLLGQAAAITDALPESANQRIAAGRWLGSGAAAAETFVHEIGHTQGRRHVFCSGGEAGTDPAYPHANGRIGVWGFGIHDFVLRPALSARDYMTYCNDAWVSDYGWEQTLDRIELLTSWDMATDPGRGRVLAGIVMPDGRGHWWTARGRVRAAEANARVRWGAGAGAIETAAIERELPDGPGTYVEAVLPAELGAHDDVRLRRADGRVVAIAASSIRGR